MPRLAKSFLVALGPALIPACASSEPGGAAIAGSASSEKGGSGGAVSGGAGSSASGTPAGGTAAGKSTGGQPATGGVTATAGTSGSGAAGSASSTGGVSASGGEGGDAGSTSVGGAVSSGGAATGGNAGTAGIASSARCPDATWNVTWGDDFDGASGSAIDSSKWAYDSGPNWYNGELQYYAAGTDNASLDGSGNLVIEARQQTREGRQYTSARIKTEGKRTFTYGRFEGRMKLPYGQGIWPAFWMLGGNSWPNSGEIDIMEHLGHEGSITYGTIHGPGYSGANGPSAQYTLPGADFADDFHVFAVEWEANAIRWYVDDTLFSTKTPADIGSNTWVFDHGFFFILNLAVGGEWPGNPDDTTVFPQKLIIDYVRVCER